MGIFNHLKSAFVKWLGLVGSPLFKYDFRKIKAHTNA